MPTQRKVPRIRPYDSAAGGWGALRATARAVRERMDVDEAPLLLYRTNKPTGFDCPGSAWPDSRRCLRRARTCSTAKPHGLLGGRQMRENGTRRSSRQAFFADFQ